MMPDQDPRPHRDIRGSWRSGVRWFAAEFLVVVSGILVAIALQSWWTSRQDRASERVLLKAMLADLDEDSTRIANAAAIDREGIVLARTLADQLDRRAAFHDTLALSYGRLGMASGASLQTAQYETLKSRGLDLVRDDDLRSLISSFYEVTGASLGLHNEWITTAEDRWMPIMLRRFRLGQDTLTAHPRNYEKLLDDEEFRLFIDEYVYYMGYAAAWKSNGAKAAGELMAELRRAIAD
jgi:hypothetical protein